MRKKDVVSIVTLDLIGLRPTRHIVIYHFGIPEFRKRLMLTLIKIAQTMQNT